MTKSIYLFNSFYNCVYSHMEIIENCVRWFVYKCITRLHWNSKQYNIYRVIHDFVIRVYIFRIILFTPIEYKSGFKTFNIIKVPLLLVLD